MKFSAAMQFNSAMFQLRWAPRAPALERVVARLQRAVSSAAEQATRTRCSASQHLHTDTPPFSRPIAQGILPPVCSLSMQQLACLAHKLQVQTQDSCTMPHQLQIAWGRDTARDAPPHAATALFCALSGSARHPQQA